MNFKIPELRDIEPQDCRVCMHPERSRLVLRNNFLYFIQHTPHVHTIQVYIHINSILKYDV